MSKMEGTEPLWEGIGTSLERATGDLVIVLFAFMAVLVVIVKYWMPIREQEKKDESELKRKQLEIEAKKLQDDVDIQRESMEAKGRQLEVLSNQTKVLEGQTEQLRTLITQNEVIKSWIDDSRRSNSIQRDLLSGIHEDVAIVKQEVSDIHSVVTEKKAATDSEANLEE